MRSFATLLYPPWSQHALQEIRIFVHFEIWIYILSSMLLEVDLPPLWQNAAPCFKSNASVATTAVQLPHHVLPSTSLKSSARGSKGVVRLLCPRGSFLPNTWSSELKFKLIWYIFCLRQSTVESIFWSPATKINTLMTRCLPPKMPNWLSSIYDILYAISSSLRNQEFVLL